MHKKISKEFTLKYKLFRSLPYWTLLEFLSLTYGYYIEMVEQYDYLENKLLNEPNCNLYYSAILANVKPVPQKKNGKNLYYPFNILEFFKEKGFPIHPELEFTKKTSVSGVAHYFWNSDISKGSDIKKNSSSLLPCNSGTDWKDITITLTSKDQVRIKTQQGEKRYNYAQIGMQDDRNTENKIRIWILLMLFASNKGDIDSKVMQDNEKIFEGSGKQEPFQTFMTAAKELNKHLKNFFGINDSIYIGHYKKMFKDKDSLKKHRPHIFEDEDMDDELKKFKRQEMINSFLKKKGYSTKFQITLNFDNPLDPAEEKSLFQQEVEEAKRIMTYNNSRTKPS